MIHFIVFVTLIVLLVVYFVNVIRMIRQRRRPGVWTYVLWAVMIICSAYLFGRRIFGWL